MTIRVVLLDSGVHQEHPHLGDRGKVVVGRDFCDGVPAGEDRLGHGTAAAAAILDLAPGCELVSLKVFDSTPSCDFDVLVDALEHALDLAPRVVNLSLGTPDATEAGRFAALVGRAARQGTTIVAPGSFRGLPSWPGVLPGVEGVLADPRLPRERPEQREAGGRVWWFASPFPRDLPGVPRDRNLAGVSFAAANLSGWLAARG